MIINADPEVGEPCMFGKGYAFFHCFIVRVMIRIYIYVYVRRNRLAEERDPDLNDEEDIRLDEIR